MKIPVLLEQLPIAFLYPEFHPITGGSSVHGYHLYDGLLKLGFKINRASWVDDGRSRRYNPRALGVLSCLRASKLAYIRISIGGKSEKLPNLAKRLGKKVVVELNGPSDELFARGKVQQSDLPKIDQRLAKALRKADAIVTVSPLMKTYCEDYLQLKNVHVVKNGGAKINTSKLKPEDYLVDLVEQAELNNQKILLWSGTDYPWQGLKKVQNLFNLAGNDFHFVIIGNEANKFPEGYSERLSQMHSLDRASIDYLISKAHGGLVYYGDYSWNRLKDSHQSSLKFYEYLINGLQTVASPLGYWKDSSYPNLLVSDDPSKALEFLSKPKNIVEDEAIYRTWNDVALETAAVFEKVMNS